MPPGGRTDDLPYVGDSSSSRSRRAIGLPAFIVLASTFCGIAALTWQRWGHPRVDAGVSLYQSARLAEGAVLYRDVLCQYGPLAPYGLAAMFAVFGIHLRVAYATGLILLVGESGLLWFISRHLLSELEAVVALVAFWVLLAFQPGLFNWVLPNVYAATFGVFFATAALAAIVADLARNDGRLLVGASVCTALAGLSKLEHGATALAALAAYCVFFRPGRRSRTAVVRTLVLAMVPGCVLTAGIVLLLTAGVPWRELVFDNVGRVRSLAGPLQNLKSTTIPPVPPLVGGAALHYLVELPLRAAAVAYGLRLLRAPWLRRTAGLALILLALGAPLLPGYPVSPDLIKAAMWQHQFAWTPVAWSAILLWTLLTAGRGSAPRSTRVLCLVAVFSLAATIRWDFRVVWPSYYAVFATCLVVVVVRSVGRMVDRTASPWAMPLVMATWIAIGARNQWWVYSQLTFPLEYPRGTMKTASSEGLPMKLVIDHLRQRVVPGDYVAVMPEEQLINFLLGTRHPTRDIAIWPGWLATKGDVARFIEELEAKRPRFVVLSGRTYPEFKVGSLLDYHPDIVQHLVRNYAKQIAFGGYAILERRPDP